MRHGLHHGTHVDVPYHFRDGARTIEQMPMAHWVGPALVVDATGEEECVSARTLEGIDLEKHKRILFKTKNSLDYYRRPAFYERFIYLDRSACAVLAARQVLTVGLDYITVDPYGSADFPAHHTLLGGGVCIIECINLGGVEPGEYYLMCLPLKLEGTDGANARAVLIRPGFCV
jgi:arylformamidase